MKFTTQIKIILNLQFFKQFSTIQNFFAFFFTLKPFSSYSLVENLVIIVQSIEGWHVMQIYILQVE